MAEAAASRGGLPKASNFVTNSATAVSNLATATANLAHLAVEVQTLGQEMADLGAKPSEPQICLGLPAPSFANLFAVDPAESFTQVIGHGCATAVQDAIVAGCCVCDPHGTCAYDASAGCAANRTNVASACSVESAAFFSIAQQH